MNYAVIQLSARLILIRWNKMATEEDGVSLIQEIDDLLDHATEKLYFISDLRKGYITHVDTLRRLSNLGKHPNFGGSTAFSSNAGATVFAGIFSRLADRFKHKDEIFQTAHQAVKYLERLNPGLTRGIDWDVVLNNADTGRATQ